VTEEKEKLEQDL